MAIRVIVDEENFFTLVVSRLTAKWMLSSGTVVMLEETVCILQ